MNSRQLDEERIFHVARKLSDVEAQTEYLDQICAGDQALRERVEALLEVHEQDQDFLRSADEPAPTQDEPLTEDAGTVIGRYKLLQKIGEGGFGVVFMAEQQSPVVRKVALKVIKPGMDSHVVIARFEAERQALALMDHPNIAHILDGGVTESGRPYFVMELVKGLPITEYCDKNELSMEDRLRLFVDVCRAVQHAHQKGIIHRDLKPSNIMVTLHDGKPVPRVIDFGVSKALHQRLTEKTLFTAFGQMIGTAQYMSPEQAEMSGLDVDTRSDVYSLGVLLYELLIGTTPLDAARLRGAGYAEIQQMIKETEPPRPSVRLSTSGEQLTAIAKHRSIEPSALQRLIRGDLDWIVMKALEKERVRRYENTSDFAADVERFLAGDAVEAHPPAAAYRLRKFVRRRRSLVATVAVVTVALILGIAGITIALVWALNQKAIAQRQQFIADMNVAMQAWEENNVRRVLQVLSRYRDREMRGFDWYHLWYLCQKTLDADYISVSDKAHEVLFSPDGQTLAVAYGHGSVEFFDAGTLKSQKSFECRRSEFYPFVAFSPDGNRVAYPSEVLSSVVVQDLHASERQQLPDHPGTVHQVAFSPKQPLLASAAGHAVVLWDLDRYEVAHVLDHDADVWSVAFSPNGRLLASGTNDGAMTLWDIEEGAEVHTVPPPSVDVRQRRLQRIWSLAFSPDGSVLAAGCGDWTVRLYRCDANDVTPLPVLSAHSDEVRSVSFSPTDNVLASASRDGTVKLWDLNDFRELDTLKGYSFGGHSCAFSPDGSILASAGVDYRVLVWDIDRENDNVIEACTAVADRVDHAYNMVFSPDGQSVITLSEGARDVVKVLSTRDGTEQATFHETTAVQSMAVSADARLALGTQGTVSLWDLGRRSKIASLKVGESRNVTALTVNDYDGTLVAGLEDGSILLWTREGRTYGEPVRLPGHQSAVTCLSLSTPGGRLASGGADHRVMVWNLLTRKLEDTLEAHRDVVLCLAFSPTENLLATGALEHEKSLCVWDLSIPNLANRQPRVFMSARSVYSLAFSPDGRVLFAAHGGDNTVRLWDVVSGQQRLRLRGHTCAVQSLALSPDGRILLSGDRYGTVRIWRAASPGQVTSASEWWENL